MRLSKKELEESVFKKFVKHTRLEILSVQSCDPPEPDILCESRFEKLYFELTDNTFEQTQKTVHAREEEIRGKPYWFNPFPGTYKQKFCKHYETRSKPCELIIYFGIHPVSELGVHFEIRLQENVHWIRQAKHKTIFRKVWIYDYYHDKILACIK